MSIFVFINHLRFKITSQIASSFSFSRQSLLINKIGQGPFASPEVKWHSAALIHMAELSFCPCALWLSQNQPLGAVLGLRCIPGGDGVLLGQCWLAQANSNRVHVNNWTRAQLCAHGWTPTLAYCYLPVQMYLVRITRPVLILPCSRCL